MTESSSKKEMMNLQISIPKELYDKLQEQLKLLKGNKIPGLENAETVEELIAFYLEHFSAGEDKMKKIEIRMQGVLDTLREKGVDVMELFDSFTQKIKEEEREGDSDTPKKSRNLGTEKKKS